MKFIKKPVVVEAVQWIGTDDSIDAIRALDTGTRAVDFTRHNVFISTLEGQMTAEIGDWVVKEVDGELYVYERDVFWLAHEAINQEEES